MFPVFGKTAVAQGGLGFSAEDIGMALSVGGVVLIVYQTSVFPAVCRGAWTRVTRDNLSLDSLLTIFASR